MLRVWLVALFFVLTYFFIVPSHLGFGQTKEKSRSESLQNDSKDQDLPEYFEDEDSPFQLRWRRNKTRNYVWPPIYSFFVPGLDQWIEGQFGSAAVYTGVATAGLGYALANAPSDDDSEEQEKKDQDDGFKQPTVTERKVAWGTQLYQTMGGLSSYHSFRTAVRTRLPLGQFSFLKKEETVGDIMLAPFKFNYLIRPTTFIPLAIAGGYAYLLLSTAADPENDQDIEAKPLSGADIFFASALSYNAGTHEEAMFRGWIQPMFMEWTDSRFWSISITSLIFAAAHLNTVSFPIAQLLLGAHLGWVTTKNQWTLGESIFIHTWWDVVVFLAVFSVQEKKDTTAMRPVLMLPPLELRF